MVVLSYNVVTMSPLLVYASFVCLILSFVLYVWRRRRIYKFASLCASPPSWPIIGNALKLIGNGEDLVKNVLDIGKTYQGKRVFFWFFSRPILFVQTVEDTKIILNSPYTLSKHSYYDLFALLAGHGLFTAPPIKWRVHRKLLLPAFTKRTIDSYVPIFCKYSDKLVSDLASYAQNRTTVDLQRHLTMFAFRVFYETAMGLNPDKDANNDPVNFLCNMEKLKGVVHNAMFNFRSVDYYTRGAFGETRHYMDAVRDFTKSVILTKKNEMAKAGKPNKENCNCLVMEKAQQQEANCDGLRTIRSFLDILLDLGETFTEKECCDEVTTFLIAGSDTTSTTIGFALLALGMCENIQRLVHAELDTIFTNRRKNEPIRVSDLPQLVYLERVIKETMRMFPVSVMIGRECDGDVKLNDGVTVPAGVGIALLVMNIHRSSDLWLNPLEFFPDRFLVTSAPDEIRRHTYAYLPFSAGPRNCIGAMFAMASMKVALATLLREYSIKTITNAKTPADLRLEMSFVTKPVEGFKVQLLRRKHDNN